MHSSTNLKFEVADTGFVQTKIQTWSLRLNNIQTTDDVIYLIATVVYVMLYGNIFFTFLTTLREKFNSYKRWLKFEIEYLSEVEKKQRNKKKPEFLRQLSVVLDKFTLINFLYSLFTLISIIKYIQFSLYC